MFETEKPRSPYKTVAVGLLVYLAFKALVYVLRFVFGAS
jgi:hypothetical protein